jgi:hypothetical protein
MWLMNKITCYLCFRKVLSEQNHKIWFDLFWNMKLLSCNVYNVTESECDKKFFFSLSADLFLNVNNADTLKKLFEN